MKAIVTISIMFLLSLIGHSQGKETIYILFEESTTNTIKESLKFKYFYLKPKIDNSYFIYDSVKNGAVPIYYKEIKDKLLPIEMVNQKVKSILEKKASAFEKSTKKKGISSEILPIILMIFSIIYISMRKKAI
ncbi:hypothetical protein [Flavobacterium kingsejongi]|uniref:Uncharacterized protein n=1 Tax=Flavobacterium kingsejongi TaxID=1678728 RepID=A0A2S1LLV4_9FLAO|nr:hypothetical protein [Flavobacterium kingsejongi]AWG24750.1 hypothetical protein FK004_05660 [Flavobacterium kingsejongi]